MQFKGQVPSMKLIEICANTLLFRSQGQLGGSQWKPWKHIMQGMKPISSQPGTESYSQSKPSFTNKSDLKPMDKDKFIEISDFYFFSNFCKTQQCWILQKNVFCKTQQCWILQKLQKLKCVYIRGGVVLVCWLQIHRYSIIRSIF